MPLKAPFTYFGGKSKVAPVVWEAFGDVPNYVEPFFGSGAIFLSRPGWHGRNQIETVNDLDGFIANFWRAVQAAPDEVARWADWPVNENDLHARHSWLVARSGALQPFLEGNPDYYNAKIAGWWVWGICQWIGSGWCSGDGPWQQSDDGQLVNRNDRDDNAGVTRKLPDMGGRGINRQLVALGGGRGINRTLPYLAGSGTGIGRRRPHLSGAQGINSGFSGLDKETGTCEEWSEHLRDMMRKLSDRLRRVRVCSGDWSRVCGPSPTIHAGAPTAVFLDPPYSHEERDGRLYAVEMPIATAVRDWAIEQGGDPQMRIALCGYEGEHEMPSDWTKHTWKATGGYGNQGDERGRENASREVVWFSPGCLIFNKQERLL